MFWPTQEQWLRIDSVAGLLTAAGTLAAVIVALYLARKDERIRLEVHAALMVMISGGGHKPTDVVSISVTNLGRRAATVKLLWWCMGFRKRQNALQKPPAGSRMPVRLADGEDELYIFPADDMRSGLSEMFGAKYRNRFSRWFWFRSLRVAVTTSTGHQFYARVDKKLRDWLLLPAPQADGEPS